MDPAVAPEAAVYASPGRQRGFRGAVRGQLLSPLLPGVFSSLDNGDQANEGLAKGLLLGARR